jgi:hypothetical protein
MTGIIKSKSRRGFWKTTKEERLKIEKDRRRMAKLRVEARLKRIQKSAQLASEKLEMEKEKLINLMEEEN